jgi:hypothetical protein
MADTPNGIGKRSLGHGQFFQRFAQETKVDGGQAILWFGVGHLQLFSASVAKHSIMAQS